MCSRWFRGRYPAIRRENEDRQIRFAARLRVGVQAVAEAMDGSEEARPRTQPVFDAIADRTVRAGQAGAGSRLKLLIEIRGDLDASATKR